MRFWSSETGKEATVESVLAEVRALAARVAALEGRGQPDDRASDESDRSDMSDAPKSDCPTPEERARVLIEKAWDAGVFRSRTDAATVRGLVECALRGAVAQAMGRPAQPEPEREPTPEERALAVVRVFDLNRNRSLCHPDAEDLRGLLAGAIFEAERAAGERVKRECLAVAQSHARDCRGRAGAFRADGCSDGKGWHARAAGAGFIAWSIEQVQP